MWENHFCNLSNGWASGIREPALEPHLHHHERVKKPSAKEARSGKWGWGPNTYLSTLFWQQIKEWGKSVSYIFWPLDTITLWSSSLKCHVALWLHSGGDPVLLTHTHVDSRQPRGEPGTMPRSAHVYLFMGKKMFSKFCLCNLSFFFLNIFIEV